MTSMRTSTAGRKAIAAHEGNKLTAYLDSVGILTIGVGHTTAAGPPEVTKGLKITAAQSDEILTRDLASVEADVNRLVGVPLTQAQFDALVSLVFNIGGTKFGKSTLLKKLNARDYAGAALQFLVWNKGTVNGKLVAIAGLTTRRKAEMVLFRSEGTNAAPPVIASASVRTDSTTIRVVQEKLKELGYTEVGTPDGKIGKLTKTAILAFRNENDLTVSDVIDDDLLKALDTAKPRSLPRNDVAAADVRAAVPEVKSNFITKIGAGGVAGTLGVSSIADLASKADSLRGWITPWKDMFSDIPGWVWLGGAALIVGAIALIAWHGERKGVEAFQEGSRR